LVVMAGKCRNVLRFVVVVSLLAVGAAGCGSSSHPDQGLRARGVPRALASEWEARASAVADAVGAGDNCHALQLASSLRDDVIAKESAVPSRLRTPLLTGVNALADRILCRPAAQAPKGPKPPKHHPHDEHHGKHQDGNGQGKD
jgi:hypothetical protein